MKKSLRVLFLLTSFIYFTKMSGQVGIGTELPDASSQLEVVAEDRGILIPRVALESTTDQITISNGNVNSLLVFNTETQSDITPGYYYWYIDRWRRIGDSSESFKETLTTLIDKGEGVFVYTDEEGGESEINVPAAVINDIINQGAVYEEVLNLIKSNETVTTLVDNGDGTITYYNEEDVDENGNIIGNGATVDVAGIIANNITNQGDVYDAIINILDADSDELIDNGDGTFTHTAADGTVVDFDANTTQFVNNGDGTYTFINKNGDSLTVDAVGNVVENIRNKGDIYNEIVQILEDSVDETITDLVYDEDENVLTYTDENGDSHTIELNNTDLYYDSINQTLVYTNSKGETQEIDLASLVAANETVTTIVNNNDGTYTYINEEDVAFIIDVPASVVENFETIVNDGPVTINGDTFNTVEEYLTHLANESVIIEGSEFISVAGSGTEGDPYVVSIEGGSENTMLITNEDGDLEWVTIEDIVQANETITDITDNGDGTYTYTNEEGAEFIIDVPASIVENFETIVNDGPVTINGDTFNTVEEYLTHIANESIAIEGSEFITVSGSGTDSDPYVVSIEEGAENTMLITNEDGDLEWVTIQEIVQANETITDITDNGDGTYTYNNEAGDAFIIDVPASVVESFETIVNDGPVTINGDTFNTVEEYLTHLANESVTIEGSEFISVAGSGTDSDPYGVSIEEGAENTMLITNEYGDLEWATIEDIVQANETITDITDNGDGTYTYTNEEGAEFIIDVPASVVENFETIVNDGPVTINGETFNTVEEYLTHIANESIAIEGSEFISVAGSGTEGDPYVVSIEGGSENTMLITNEDGDLEWATIEDIVQANETLTVLSDNGNGSFTYTDENGDDITFDATRAAIIDNGDGSYTIKDADGNDIIIDIPGDIINNFESIVHGDEVIVDGITYTNIEEYFTTLAENNETVTELIYDAAENTLAYTDEEGNVQTIQLNITDLSYDADDNKLVYTNSKGEEQEIDLASLVAANETITDIIDNGDGTYTYNNEAGDAFIIDVPASVVENFETIVNDGPVTINGDTFNTVEEYLTHLANESIAIEGSEFITVAGAGTDSDPYIVSIEEGAENTMLITNEDGDLEWATIEDIVQANETITDITDNGDGTYTYTNEEGDTFIIDVPASVVENFETIVNDGPVTINGDTFNTVEEYLTHLANESVAIEGSEFISVAGSGTDSDPYIVSIEEGAEKTMLITNEDGDLEWATIEDIVQANETLTILSDNGNGSFTYTDENGDDITFDATRAAIIDNGDGSYTIKDADGNDIIIDIPGDIINNFESIVHGDEVIVDGITYTNIEEYFTTLAENNETVTELIYDAAENTLAYTDEEGNVQTIQLNITDLSYDADDNKLVYTNSKGDEQEIDLVSLVAANETITDITDNGDGTYTYTNEEGAEFIIDVPASVVENFETIVNDGPVTINGDTFNTVEEYLTHLANESVAIEGSEFIEVSGSGTEGDPYIVSIEGGSENTMLITNEDGDIEWVTIEDIVQANETITEIIDNGDGTYTYTNEEGNTFIIDVPASVVENFETIVNDGPVTINGDTFNTVEEYLTHLANESVAIEGSEFISVAGSGTDSDPYIVSIEEGAENTMLITNEDGDLEWATIEDIVQANETITDITDNGNGTYTYNNEADDAFIIDVPASVVENFETIVNDGPVTINGDTFNTVEEYLTHLASESVTIEGSEFISVAGSGTDSDPYLVSIEEGAENTLLITNEDGDLEWATIEDIVQDNETLTVLSDNGNGSFTYTDENGDDITFDATRAAITDNGDGSYTIKDADGNDIIIDIPGDIINNFESIVHGDEVIVDGITYTNIEEYFTTLAENNETVTALIYDAAENTLAYTDEEGNVQIIQLNVTDLSYDADDNKLVYTNSKGEEQEIDLASLVAANETITDIIDNGDGTYTYNNEAGDAFIIDVPASVVENFETIVNDGPVTVNGDTFNTVEEYLTHLANESVAIEGSEFITVAGSGTDTDPYIVSIEEGAENTMLITNEDGDLEWATIEDIVQANETITDITNNGDGTYTYNNEAGDAFIIDVPASVVENFETIVKDGPVTVDGVEYTTVEEYLTQIAEISIEIEGGEFINVSGSGTEGDPYIVSIEGGSENTMLITDDNGNVVWATIEDIVQDNETVTFFEDEDGIYTYTNEEGDTFEINIPASVVENFETIVKNGPVIVDGVEYTTVEEYIIQIAEEGVSIEGSEFINVSGSGTEGDPYIVSIEGGSENTMLITNEEGGLEWTTIEEIVQGNQKTYKVIGEGMIEVEEAEDENETTYTVKSNAPDFFYMPAVIFDTSVNGTATRNLYEEYKDQFTGGDLDIAHGVNGSSMPYTGGLVGSAGAPQAIHVYESDELYYYVTYYDEDVFENLSISADGKLTYTVKNNAEPHSYMNVVFVIKDAE